MKMLTDEQREEVRCLVSRLFDEWLEGGIWPSARVLSRIEDDARERVLGRYDAGDGHTALDIADVRIVDDKERDLVLFHIEDK